MRIVIAASEAVPYAKVGGLGDVTGALPGALARQGHEVWLVLPKYEAIDYVRHGLAPYRDGVRVRTGAGDEGCRVHHTHGADGVRTFFIENHDHFSRYGIYDDPEGRHYPDNGRRFAFFSQAVLQLCHDEGFAADVIHAHDWPTALIPALLKLQRGDDSVLSMTGSLLTIHNLAHQGKYPRDVLRYARLPESLWSPDRFEDYGQVNLMKGGVAYADIVSTVSPTYAREILDEPGACGLHTYLRRREADLHGVLNGADDGIWSPERDPLIPSTFSRDDLTGKAICKRQLQAQMGLDTEARAPLFGVVARLTEQKGSDLVAGAVDDLVVDGAQVVVVGTGERAMEDALRAAADRHPGRVAVRIGFSEPLAHVVEAGADFFLMPSRFEPCGLSQIYSLRYGTLPIVRSTGGLVDTVEPYDPATGGGTGFRFDGVSVDALIAAARQAMTLYRERPDHHLALVRRAMAQRFSWDRAATRYVQLYEWAVAKRRAWR